jgi:uncharacterized protein
MLKSGHLARLFLAGLVGMFVMVAPAAAQFSDSYKFLEGVRKKDGAVVTEYLNEPGSTLVNTRDRQTGDSALHIVTQRRDLAWIRYLIGNGADPNIRNEKGVTPLVLAANLGFVEGVEVLVNSGARVDEASQTGETPLIAAVHRHDIGVVRLLLKAGADPDRADNSGRSARDYAALDGGGNSVLAEIESSAKSAAERAGAPSVYGPSF